MSVTELRRMIKHEIRFDKELAVNDIENPERIKAMTMALFGCYIMERDKCLSTLADLESRIDAVNLDKSHLKKDSFRTQFRRVIRSIGIVALYVLGIVTVVPAIVLYVKAKKQINDTWHKYVTYKSLERIALEDRWEALKEEAKLLKNVTEFRGKIVQGNQKLFRTVPEMISYMNEPEKDRALVQFRADQASIQARIGAVRQRLS